MKENCEILLISFSCLSLSY